MEGDLIMKSRGIYRGEGGPPVIDVLSFQPSMLCEEAYSAVARRDCGTNEANK